MTAPPPELAALLAACRARPADDLPRLVLADWLDEHGQPERAEFVRVQVELSHPTADTERTALLKHTERRLLTRHEDEWVGGCKAALQAMRPPLRPDRRGYTGPLPPAHKFVRGLLRIGNAVQFVNRGELREWLRSPELPWLEQVSLEFNTVDGFVKAEWPDELTNRIGLTIDLRNYRFDPATHREQFRLVAVSSNFASVRSFTVLGASGEVVLDEITGADVSPLVEMTLTGGVDQRVASLVASAPFTSLSSLDIGPISEAGLRALIASPHLGNLTHLDLRGSPIGDAGVIALCRSRLADTLRSVEFPNTGISDIGLTALVRSPLFAHMHGPRLNLMMNRIGDAGLTALAESEHLLRFRELVLRENVVGDDGVEALAASPYAANLQYLDFWRNRITDRGARALARSPHLNKVVDLSVKENAVTAAGAAALHERFGERAKT